MAISTESANRVRQKVRMYTGVTPGVFHALKAVFLHLAMNKGNPDLQFIPYSYISSAAPGCTQNGGYSPDVDACTVYAWYGKAQRTSGTTAAFMSLHDATDNSASTTTIATQKISATGQNFLQFWPDGLPVATELTVACATAVGGATESTNTDSCNGFIIIGA